MKITCSKDPRHSRFTAIAHVTEEWITNEQGELIETNRTQEVTHRPDASDLWRCYICGAEAKVES